ncbi:MAG: ABC transporter ATP-binding protein [Clostridia bacterium]|nr:ABC transporter ATP-binding protein [Clostridia bacterium]
MIILENISAGYGKYRVLHGISAHFENKRLISVIGPNGSGKSTLFKVMSGLIPCTGGSIFADNESLSGLNRRGIAKSISYLSQSKGIPDMTVAQMVLHGRFPYLAYPRRYRESDRKIAYEAMKTLGIEKLADTPLYALSGGMRQTAYIAMALAQDTDHILLDEPTTYLDISHQIALSKTLRSLADSGKCVISVMHDLVLALNISDDILVLDKGCAVAFGTPGEIFNSGIIDRVFGISLDFNENGYNYKYPPR